MAGLDDNEKVQTFIRIGDGPVSTKVCHYTGAENEFYIINSFVSSAPANETVAPTNDEPSGDTLLSFINPRC